MENNTTLINFTELTLKEKKMILSWRNNKNIKIWMYDNLDIKLQHHIEFIKSLKMIKDKRYFLVKIKNIYIGVINFTYIDYINKECQFGLYANPKLKGVGKILLNIIIDYAFKNLDMTTLKAEVFRKNIKAIKLYKKFHFTEIGNKEFHNKDIIIMELDNILYSE